MRKKAEKANVHQEGKSQRDIVTCCQAESLSLSHRSNTAAPQETAKHMGPTLPELLAPQDGGQKSTLKSIQTPPGFETNKTTTCTFDIESATFGVENVEIISTFKEGVNTAVCVSVRQEIPWDVFNKNGQQQQQPRNWQMKTC